MIAEALKKDLTLKWDRMRTGLKEMGMDACLLSIDVNLLYTTGRIYGGYFYLPVEGDPWFFVRRPNGLSGNHVVYIRKLEEIPALLTDAGLVRPERLLLELDELSYNEAQRLLKALSLIHI